MRQLVSWEGKIIDWIAPRETTRFPPLPRNARPDS